MIDSIPASSNSDSGDRVLARPAAPTLGLEQHTLDDQLAAPHPVLLTPLERFLATLHPQWAASASPLGDGHLLRLLTEEDLGILVVAGQSIDDTGLENSHGHDTHGAQGALQETYTGPHG